MSKMCVSLLTGSDIDVTNGLAVVGSVLQLRELVQDPMSVLVEVSGVALVELVPIHPRVLLVLV